MQKFQSDFIELALFSGALKFGSFTLKSGRISPYFFNSGVFYSGEYTRALSVSMANLVARSLPPEKYDVIFGPAYKGIPLAVSLSMALAAKGIDKPWCFNRKEAKDHGDKGTFVGAPINDGTRLILLDDVFTTGGAKEEAILQLKSVAKIEIPAVFILLDRKEKGEDGKNAIREFEIKHKTHVFSMVDSDSIFDYLSANKVGGKLHVKEAELLAYKEYKMKYGV